MFKIKKKLVCPIHFPPHPKIGPALQNDQKWVFIKYGCVKYHWKVHVKKISKRTKNFCSVPPTSCPTQKSVPDPKWSKNRKIGVHWVWPYHIPLESPWKGYFKKTKKFWPSPPKNWSWDQNDPKCLGASHQSSSMIAPTLLKSQ